MMLASMSASANSRRHRADIPLQPGCDPARVTEIAELGPSGEGRGAEGHHRYRADDDEHDAEAEIDLLVAHEARRDPLVDDVALLEEQLPGRHRGADDGDDQQHHLRELGARGEPRHEEVPGDLAYRRVHDQHHGHEQEAAGDERQREAFEAAEVAGARGRDHEDCSCEHAPELWHTEIIEAEADADELGDERQGVEEEQVDDAERAPEPAEPL